MIAVKLLKNLTIIIIIWYYLVGGIYYICINVYTQNSIILTKINQQNEIFF